MNPCTPLHTDPQPEPRFKLGEIVITAAAAAKLHRPSVDAATLRHAASDWGEVCREDAEQNELGLRHGYRLLSVYRDRSGEKFWIITEADRSVTTILLPDDY